MKKYDVVILTQKKFYQPNDPDWYIKQVLKEDLLIQNAFEKRGYKVIRTYWDNEKFNFSSSKTILFRSIWDYFHRFNEFSKWLKKVENQTKLINPSELIFWNIDKHYLQDLFEQGVNIPNTLFIAKGDKRSLKQIHIDTGWKHTVLKPTVSGAGRHTYKLSPDYIEKHEVIYRQLIIKEDMMLQEYQKNITVKGEAAFIIFNGKYCHSILKKAKPGDYRVQDDFGGTVHKYDPSDEEIKFAEEVVASCNPLPIYARVDVIWDNNNNPAVIELELIEPELWFRYSPKAAELLADSIIKVL